MTFPERGLRGLHPSQFLLIFLFFDAGDGPGLCSTPELRALPGGDLFQDWHSQRNFSVQLTFFEMHLWFGMVRHIYHFRSL